MKFDFEELGPEAFNASLHGVVDQLTTLSQDSAPCRFACRAKRKRYA